MPTIMGRNVSAAKAQRMAVAFGRELGLGRDANVQEIEADIENYTKRVVEKQEENIAAEARVKTPFDLA